jgi:fatty acid desaturase
MFGNLTDLIHIITNLLLAAVPVLAALALLFFFWGIAQFMLAAGETEERKKGKDRIIWGLVALFVILSVAALVTLLQQTVFGGVTQSSASGAASSAATNAYNAPIIVPQADQPPPSGVFHGPPN